MNTTTISQIWLFLLSGSFTATTMTSLVNQLPHLIAFCLPDHTSIFPNHSFPRLQLLEFLSHLPMLSYHASVYKKLKVNINSTILGRPTKDPECSFPQSNKSRNGHLFTLFEHTTLIFLLKSSQLLINSLFVEIYSVFFLSVMYATLFKQIIFNWKLISNFLKLLPFPVLHNTTLFIRIQYNLFIAPYLRNLFAIKKKFFKHLQIQFTSPIESEDLRKPIFSLCKIIYMASNINVF